jgi:hypothetical protein
MVKAPHSVINLAHEVVEWMDGQRDTQFPFSDTYLMWNYIPHIDIETYNCTFPYWRRNHNTIMEDISLTGQFSETIARISVIKGTEKGICLPYPMTYRECYYIIKGTPPSIISKSYKRLVSVLDVPDYKLFDFPSRGVHYTPTEEGAGYSSGNLWYQNVHLTEGDIVVYVRYHDK